MLGGDGHRIQALLSEHAGMDAGCRAVGRFTDGWLFRCRPTRRWPPTHHASIDALASIAHPLLQNPLHSRLPSEPEIGTNDPDGGL